MRNKYVCPHVLLRDGVYYYLRRVPYDLTDQIRGCTAGVGQAYGEGFRIGG